MFLVCNNKIEKKRRKEILEPRLDIGNNKLTIQKTKSGNVYKQIYTDNMPQTN